MKKSCPCNKTVYRSVLYVSLIILLLFAQQPSMGHSLLIHEFLNDTKRCNTAGRTPLDEKSARRKDHLTTHNTHNRQTSMPPVGLEPKISAGQRPQAYALGYGYTGARNDTTQQLGQTPDKEAEIKNITVYVCGYTETDTTGMLSPPTVWRKKSESVSSRHPGQIPAAVRLGFERRCSGQNGYRLKCGHTFLQCILRQMLVFCVVSFLAPM
jgi:hypothetical protein